MRETEYSNMVNYIKKKICFEENKVVFNDGELICSDLNISYEVKIAF